MAGLKVVVEGKSYDLKFGYGVFSRISKMYKIPGFSGLGEFIDNLELSKGKDLKFEALDFIGNLVKCSAEYLLKEEVPFSGEDVINDLLFKGTDKDKLTEIIQELFNSFAPLLESEGKPNPATRNKKK